MLILLSASSFDARGIDSSVQTQEPSICSFPCKIGWCVLIDPWIKSILQEARIRLSLYLCPMDPKDNGVRGQPCIECFNRECQGVWLAASLDSNELSILVGSSPYLFFIVRYFFSWITPIISFTIYLPLPTAFRISFSHSTVLLASAVVVIKG